MLIKREYLKYPAFIAQRSEEKGYLFPKIRICSNSMHSRFNFSTKVLLYNWLFLSSKLKNMWIETFSVLNSA